MLDDDDYKLHKWLRDYERLLDEIRHVYHYWLQGLITSDAWDQAVIINMLPPIKLGQDCKVAFNLQNWEGLDCWQLRNEMANK